MKKIIFFTYTLILFGLSIQSIGQSVEKLDEKFGFKSFKFGSPPNKEKSIIVNSWEKKQNIETYQYTGNDMDQLYGAEIEAILLEYFNNKLISIMVVFKSPFLESDYKPVLFSLQQLFGNGGNCISENPEFSNSSGRKWIGEKVEMELLNFLDKKNSNWSGYLAVTNKSLQRQRLNDEF